MAKRGQTFPLPGWWLQDLQSKLAKQGGQAKTIADIQRHFGVAVGAPEMSRALKGKHVTISLALQLSTVLGMPPPIFLPKTEREARALLAEQAIFLGVTPQLAAIRAAVEAEEAAGREEASADGGSRRRGKPTRVGPRRPTTS